MMGRKIFGNVCLLSFLLVVILAAGASAQPALPAAYYGSATINGRAVPSGSVITAQIDGISKGSIVVSPEGKYGDYYLTEEGKLHVNGGSSGDEIAFYVQTPSMSNRLVASEKGTWQSGQIVQLNLTFTGEEMAKAEQESQGGGSGSSGSGSSGDSGAVAVPAEPSGTVIQNQGTVHDIDLAAGNITVSLGNKDAVKFAYNGKDVEVMVKSFSDFAVLFTTPGGDVVAAEKSTSQVDIDGDGFAELQIRVGQVKDGLVDVTFALLQKPEKAVTLGPGATGMVLVDNGGLWISVSAIAVIAVLGAGIYVWRKRGVKNEGYQGFN